MEHKRSSDKLKGTQNALFFFRKLQLIPVLLLTCIIKVCLSKTVCGIFYFRFRFVFIKVLIFVQQNAWTL